VDDTPKIHSQRIRRSIFGGGFKANTKTSDETQIDGIPQMANAHEDLFVNLTKRNYV